MRIIKIMKANINPNTRNPIYSMVKDFTNRKTWLHGGKKEINIQQGKFKGKYPEMEDK